MRGAASLKTNRKAQKKQKRIGRGEICCQKRAAKSKNTREKREMQGVWKKKIRKAWFWPKAGA